MQGDEHPQAHALEHPGDRAEQAAQAPDAGQPPVRGTAARQQATSSHERAILAKRRELAAHERAILRHEQAVKLQEKFGHPDRAANARKHAQHARNLREQALRELEEHEGRRQGEE